jgi:hypothetical protein
LIETVGDLMKLLKEFQLETTVRIEVGSLGRVGIQALKLDGDPPEVSPGRITSTEMVVLVPTQRLAIEQEQPRKKQPRIT